MILTDELCDKLCEAAKEKSRGITLAAGGYPLFVNGRIAGGIGVGGGTEEQDFQIAEYVVSVFEKLAG